MDTLDNGDDDDDDDDDNNNNNNNNLLIFNYIITSAGKTNPSFPAIHIPCIKLYLPKNLHSHI